MRDPLWLTIAWLAVVVAIVAAFLVVDRRHQRRAWRQADIRAREILKSESEVVDYVEARRGSIRAGARRNRSGSGRQ